MTADDMSQFLDTNILVYAYDNSAGSKYIQARKLITDLWDQKNGRLSIQVLQEFFVTVTKKIPNTLSSGEAAQIIADLGVWPVHRPGVSDVLDAVQLKDHYQISFWDSMIISSAQKQKCTILWSEDLNDGQDYGGVIVRNPFL